MIGMSRTNIEHKIGECKETLPPKIRALLLLAVETPTSVPNECEQSLRSMSRVGRNYRDRAMLPATASATLIPSIAAESIPPA